MTDIERIRGIMTKLINLAEDVDGLLDGIERAKDDDRATIERLEEEVADLTSDLEDARRGE